MKARKDILDEENSILVTTASGFSKNTPEATAWKIFERHTARLHPKRVGQGGKAQRRGDPTEVKGKGYTQGGRRVARSAGRKLEDQEHHYENKTKSTTKDYQQNRDKYRQHTGRQSFHDAHHEQCKRDGNRRGGRDRRGQRFDRSPRPIRRAMEGDERTVSQHTCPLARQPKVET